MRCPFCKSSAVTQHRSSVSAAYTCLTCQRSFGSSRRAFWGKSWLIALGVLGLSSPLLLNASMKTIANLLPTSRDETVASIIVLGRGPSDRAERALATSEIFQTKPVPVFVSGMTDAPQIVKVLHEMGVEMDYLSGERCSQTTWENGLFSEASLKPKAETNVLLVTDEPHMLRAYLVFQSFGFDVTPHAVPSEKGLFSLQQARVVLREYAALATYTLRGKLHSKSESVQEADQRQAILKMDDWGCRL
ncbi:YdcF family protein [Oscillatoria sp. CS-180]|uniref:YdcF family protein n=1 Tax=Oscillatoria sp. CS-180 TaxID=3021720 RepID=UPI00232DF015|nr:YdcF family protein [Oscillatoria sp. CS-180]MDB9527494.1 YdcF family protein [Oscillatoria sp. CS-180]